MKIAYLSGTLWLAAAAVAGPPLTTIKDTLYKADGTLFTGSVQIAWKSFEAGDESNIAQQSVTVKVVDGALGVRLAPTTDSSTGAAYNVKYNSEGKVMFEETWAVPPSITPLRVRDVRQSAVNAAMIKISDVQGLSAELAARPLKGVGYVPSRTAIINSSGAISVATGNAADCVRVNGSSGACASPSEVQSLATQVAALPVKGATYAPNRAAVINAAGALGAASGNASDCVRADGSSGPCASPTEVQAVATQLATRPVMAATYAPNRTAVINSAGALEAANGNATDCVKVDGSSGPCSVGTPAIIDQLVEDVEELSADLAIRPVRGPGYAPGRVAVINASGALEAVSGADSDCLRVDGTAGPCGEVEAPLSPLFVDQEVPGGIVDGFNTVFALASPPAPAASLAVYRNGIRQKAGYDFGLSGNTIQFVAEAAPYPGDTVLASYRVAGEAAIAASQTNPSPEVICSKEGTGGQHANMTVLGTCALPPLVAGDRIEASFDYTGNAAFSIEVRWNTLVLAGKTASGESAIAGRAEIASHTQGAQWNSLTWAGGTVGGQAGSAALTAAPLEFSGQGDVRLRSFTVVKYPARQ
jgi:hypothetical protein